MLSGVQLGANQRWMNWPASDRDRRQGQSQRCCAHDKNSLEWTMIIQDRRGLGDDDGSSTNVTQCWAYY